MKIEKGKYYRTRGGKKVEVLTTERRSKSPIIIMDENGEIEALHQNGMYLDCKSETILDLIAEWTEPIEIPWSDYPTWCKWVAMDKDGRWFGYSDKPTQSCAIWSGDAVVKIHPDYTPRNFTGDWTESLFERP
jgi:hypothetical protein